MTKISYQEGYGVSYISPLKTVYLFEGKRKTKIFLNHTLILCDSQCSGYDNSCLQSLSSSELCCCQQLPV